jgi:hypothetical protein
MEIDKIVRGILYSGSIVLILGMIMLAILQIMLGRRLEKNFFTFLSVVFYPSNELTDAEKLIRKSGIVLSLAGAVIILGSAFLLWTKGGL